MRVVVLALLSFSLLAPVASAETNVFVGNPSGDCVYVGTDTDLSSDCPTGSGNGGAMTIGGVVTGVELAGNYYCVGADLALGVYVVDCDPMLDAIAELAIERLAMRVDE